MLTYLAPQRGKVVVLAAVLLATTGLQLAVPLILQRFIDGALDGQAKSVLIAAGIAYLFAGLANQIFSAVTTYLGADIGWTATNRLREDLAHHLLGLDMGFHTNTTPGEMIERIDGDVTAVANFLSRFVVRLLGAGLLLVGVIAVAWNKSPLIGIGYSVFVVAVLWAIYSMRNLAVAAAEDERETSALLYGFIEERLAAIEDIRANGAGEFTMRRFVGVMRDYFFRTTTAWRKRTHFRVTSNLIFWTGSSLALALGVRLVQTGAASVGTAYLLYQYVLLIQNPIDQVTQQFSELQKAAGGIVRIDQYRAISSDLPQDGTEELPDGPLSVEFARVDFSYEDQQILHGVTFELAPGTVLGLLGRTGGGKTTTTRLISRLYDPDGGTVRIAGIDLRDVAPGSLRSRVGVVTQDVQLFRASVRDNLTFFDHSRSDAELLAKLDAVGLGQWIRAVGLDAELGAGGSGLSAGESQLLAFARVFLQNPGVVILDEPASRLDPATEQLVASATEQLFQDRTVVIVAHRLETVRLADQIMVIDDGRIAEHGLRDVLATTPSTRYAKLLAAGGGSLLDGALPAGALVANAPGTGAS
ncbi:MAG: ABC transporter ATP-binding protein [Acidimicrobiales bacterium]